MFDEIRQDDMEGILVQQMVQGGVELMIGVAPDPLFGPLIAFGLGGIHVEILADVRFRVTPLSDQDAHEMVRGIRGYRLLQGYRGHPPADIAAIEEVLLRVSRLVEDIPEIRELDLNPDLRTSSGTGVPRRRCPDSRQGDLTHQKNLEIWGQTPNSNCRIRSLSPDLRLG